MSYEDYLDKNSLKNSDEYKQNQMQIDCIKKVLIEHADVPEVLLNCLIKSVRENTIIEFKKNNI